MKEKTLLSRSVFIDHFNGLFRPFLCHLDFLGKEGRQVETSGYDDVQRINNHRDQNGIHTAEDGGQECARPTEEHVIRLKRIVDDICRNGEDQARNTGQEQLPNALDARVAVIARQQHQQASKQHHCMVNHRMHRREGDDGIAIQHGHRVEEIHRRT